MSPDVLAPLRRGRRLAAAAIVVLAAVVLATAEADSTVPEILPLLLVALTGVAAVGGVVAAERMLWRRRPTADAAVGALTGQTYLQLAIAEFPLVLSVALAYVLGPTWSVLIGAACALVAVTVGFPTTARARRLETHWDLPPATLTGGAVPAADDTDVAR